jgi:hypothetical protein
MKKYLVYHTAGLGSTLYNVIEVIFNYDKIEN